MTLFDTVNKVIAERMGPNHKLGDGDTSFARALCDAIEQYVEAKLAEPCHVNVEVKQL